MPPRKDRKRYNTENLHQRVPRQTKPRKGPRVTKVEVTGIEGVTMVFSRKIPLIGGNGRIKELWVSWELLGALVLAHREVQQVESKKWRAGNGL